MSRRPRAQGVKAALLAVLVVASFTAVPVVSADDHQNPPPETDTVQVSDRVGAWERAILPLRAETDDAAVTIPNADWRVRSPDGPETSLNRDTIAVYDANDEIELTYDLSDAGGNSKAFAGEEVEVVAAHVTEDSPGAIPDTFRGAMDMLSMETANDNVSFTEVTTATLDDDGDLTVEHTPDKSGHWMYFAATTEDGEKGFTTADGDLAVDGQVTVVGMEQVVVREGAGDVSVTDEVERGDSVAFDVDAEELDGQVVRHGLVLYDEETFTEQSVVLSMENSDGAFDLTNDTTVETTVDAVNGVGTVATPLSALGVTVQDRQVERRAPVGTSITFLGEQAGTGAPEVVDRSADHVAIDGSANVAQAPGTDATVTVPTQSDWNTGEYRWVYVAVGNGSDELVVQSDTIGIETADSDNDDEKDGDDKDDKDDTKDGDDKDDTEDKDDKKDKEKDDTKDEDEREEDDKNEGDKDENTDSDDRDGEGPPIVVPDLSPNGDDVVADVGEITGDVTVALPVGDVVSADRDVSLEWVNVTAATNASDARVTVDASAERPDGVPAVAAADQTVGFIEVSPQNMGNAHGLDGEFTFHVSEDRLDELGADADDVVLYRNVDDSWEPLETTHEGDGQFSAETPGFSMFAVGVTDTTASNGSDAESTQTEPTDTGSETAGTGSSGDASTETDTSSGDSTDSSSTDASTDSVATTDESTTLTDARGGMSMAIGGFVAAVVALVAGAYYLRNRR